MPKSTLKLHLQSFTKEQIIDLVLQVYDSTIKNIEATHSIN